MTLIGEIARAVAGAVRHWAACRKAIRELEAYQAYQLADLGITRDQIEDYVTGAPLPGGERRSEVPAPHRRTTPVGHRGQVVAFAPRRVFQRVV